MTASNFPITKNGENIQYFFPVAASAVSRSAGLARKRASASNSSPSMASLMRGFFCTFRTHWRLAFAVPIKTRSPHYEPNVDLVRATRLAAIVSQYESLFASKPLQPRQCIRVHDISLRVCRERLTTAFALSTAVASVRPARDCTRLSDAELRSFSRCRAALPSFAQALRSLASPSAPARRLLLLPLKSGFSGVRA